MEEGLVVGQAQEVVRLVRRFVPGRPALFGRRDLVDRDRWQEEVPEVRHEDGDLLVRVHHVYSARAQGV